MKSVKFWLLVGFLASPIYVFSFLTDNLSDQLRTTAVVSADHRELRLALSKSATRPATITLETSKGEVVAEQFVGKNIREKAFKFDVSELTDGTYRLVVTDGVQKRVKLITLQAVSQPQPDRQLQVDVLE